MEHQREPQIMIITSSQVVVDRAREAFLEKGWDIPAIRCDFTQTARRGRQAVEQGAKIIISRGYSAVLLRRELDIPVVEIKMTGFDFISSVNQARAKGQKLAIVGYTNIWKQYLEQYRSLLGNPRIVYIKVPSELPQVVQKLEEEGVKAIVGGDTTCRVARKLGLQAIHIGVEDGSIHDAVIEAEHLLRIEMARAEQDGAIRSLLNCTYEGALTLNIEGQITSYNASAVRLMGEGWQGRRFAECLSKPELVQQVLGGKKISDELAEVEGALCTLSGQPFLSMGKPQGAVFTLQPVRQVQMLEQNIRKKLKNSGSRAKYTFQDILGTSAATLAAKEKAKQYAKSSSTVLITGETGTGKELFAQSIHNASSRARMPFVAINCAALPQDILESELFGYVKGAFTGARAEGKAGVFEQAHRGTIFLDEIGELSAEVQSKLLRVLQEKEIRRIGDTTVFEIDVRVIAATNKDLKREMEAGRFRPDLFYRLAVLELELPSLRQRRQDTPDLVAYLLHNAAQQEKIPLPRLSQTALTLLTQQEWPGNIRQLHNVVERLVVLGQGDEIDARMVRTALGLPEEGESFLPAGEMPGACPKGQTGYGHQKMAIARALRQAGGNRARAAQALRISTTTLWRRLKALEAEEPDFVEKALFESEP